MYDIGAVAPLRKLASSLNKLASRFACDALNILGEKVPYKLSSHAPPLWNKTDVQNWLKQVGEVSQEVCFMPTRLALNRSVNFQTEFDELADKFFKLNVDGDVLLSLTPEQLKYDVGITNGIQRQL